MRTFVVSLVTLVLLLGTFYNASTEAQPAACITTSTGDENLVYDVKVVFTGLMTFVPGTNTATVIIPDVKDGSPDIGDDNHSIHEHRPYILARTDAMCQQLPLNSKHLFRKARFEPATYHYLVLDGEQISVDDDNAITDTALNGPLDYTKNAPDPNVYCPAGNTQGSLYWLSSIGKVTGATQVPDPNHFAKQPPRDVISGRIILRQGALQTHVIKKSRPWEFRIPVGPGQPMKKETYTQALAQEVEWSFKARGVPFILNLNAFDGSGGRRLAFVPDRGAKELVIIIGNTVHNDTGPIPATATGAPTRDDHYSVYHRFVDKNSHGDGPIPHPKGPPQCNEAYLSLPTLKPATFAASLTKPAVSPHAHAMAVTGDPAPSGLNCSPNQWP